MWEIFCTNFTNCKFDIALSVSEKKRFEDDILSQPDLFLKMLSNVDVYQSDAFKYDDKKRIFQVILCTVGFERLNALVIDTLSKWYIKHLTAALSVDTLDVKYRRLNGLGRVLELQGQYSVATMHLSELTALLRQDPSKTLVDIVRAMLDLARCELKSGSVHSASRALNECAQTIQQNEGLNFGMIQYEVNHSLAVAYRLLRRYDDARRLLDDCRNVVEAFTVGNEILLIDILSELSAVYDAQRHPVLALTVLLQALETAFSAFGASNLISLQLIRKIAGHFWVNGDSFRTASYLERCVGLMKVQLGLTAPDTLEAMEELADAIVQSQDAEEVDKVHSLYTFCYSKRLETPNSDDFRVLLLKHKLDALGDYLPILFILVPIWYGVITLEGYFVWTILVSKYRYPNTGFLLVLFMTILTSFLFSVIMLTSSNEFIFSTAAHHAVLGRFRGIHYIMAAGMYVLSAWAVIDVAGTSAEDIVYHILSFVFFPFLVYLGFFKTQMLAKARYQIKNTVMKCLVIPKRAARIQEANELRAKLIADARIQESINPLSVESGLHENISDFNYCIFGETTPFRKCLRLNEAEDNEYSVLRERADEMISVEYIDELKRLELVKKQGTCAANNGLNADETISADMELAEWYTEHKRCENSVQIIRSCLEKASLTKDPNHPDIASMFSALGDIYQQMFEYQEAYGHYSECLKRLRIFLNRNDPRIYMAIAKASRSLAFQGKTEDAEVLCAEYDTNVTELLNKKILEKWEFVNSLEICWEAIYSISSRLMREGHLTKSEMWRSRLLTLSILIVGDDHELTARIKKTINDSQLNSSCLRCCEKVCCGHICGSKID